MIYVCVYIYIYRHTHIHNTHIYQSYEIKPWIPITGWLMIAEIQWWGHLWEITNLTCVSGEHEKDWGCRRREHSEVRWAGMNHWWTGNWGQNFRRCETGGPAASEHRVTESDTPGDWIITSVSIHPPLRFSAISYPVTSFISTSVKLCIDVLIITICCN